MGGVGGRVVGGTDAKARGNTDREEHDRAHNSYNVECDTNADFSTLQVSSHPKGLDG